MNKRWDETKKETKIKGKLDICPCCGSNQLDFDGPSYKNDTLIIYDVHCYTCDYKFKELYTIKLLEFRGYPLIKKRKKAK